MVNSKLDYPFKHSSYQLPFVDFEVNRDESLKNLKYITDKENSYIFVNGESGIGKSILLKQLAYELGRNVIALFIDPVSNLGMSDSFIKNDISEQISWLVQDKTSIDKVDLNQRSDHYVQYISMLAQYTKKSEQRVVMIIDGLDDIQDKSYVENILGLIPFHLPGVKFIISSNSQMVLDRFTKRKEAIAHFSVPLMTNVECKVLLGDTVTIEDVESIISVYEPLPEKISSIRRIINKGHSVNDLLNGYGEYNNSILDAEWRLNENRISENLTLISLLVFCPFSATLDELHSVLSLDCISINSLLSDFSFLKVNDSVVTFANVGFKRYLTEKLLKDKNIIKLELGLLVARRSRTADNILTIVEYKFTESDYEGVISELADGALVEVYKEKKNLYTLSKILNLAAKSTNDRKYIAEKIKFSHLLSLINGVSEITVLKSEIELYISDEDFVSAMSLADEAVLDEEKIQLLAMIASAQKKSNLIVDPSLLSKVEYLYSNLDLEHMDIKTSIDISVAIFSIFPKLSFEIISFVDKKGAYGENKSDYAYARFYFEAVLKNNEELQGFDLDEMDIDEQFKSSIKSIQDLKGDLSVDKFFVEIKSLSLSNGDKISLMIETVKVFPQHKEIVSIVMDCLNLILETPEYSSNSTTYKVLSSCLHLHKENFMASDVCNKILQQTPRLKDIGPTVDYVKMMINIASFEFITKRDDTKYKSIFNYVKNNVSDYVLNLKCVMAIQSAWNFFDYKRYWGELIKHKNVLFDKILFESAQHYNSLKDSIEEEAKINIKSAISICNKLNTQDRRDKAISKAVISHINNCDNIDVVAVCDFIINIKNFVEFARAAYSLIEAVHESSKLVNELSDVKFQRLRKLKNRFHSSADRLIYISYLLCVYKKSNLKINNLENNLSSELLDYFSKVDGDWNKINIGFKVSKILAISDVILSKEIREKVIDIRKKSEIDAYEIKNSYVRCLELIIRVNNSLLKAGNYREENVTSVIQLVSVLSGDIEKSRLFSKLISSLQINGFESQASYFINKSVIDMLDSFDPNYSKEFGLVFYSIAPCIYKYDKEQFFEYLGRVSDFGLYNDVLSSTVSYFFEKIMLWEPYYYSDKNSYDLTFQDVRNTVNLLLKMTQDWLIVSHLKRLTYSLKQLFKQKKFTETQRLAILGLYEDIINKFPLVDCINHKGYAICSRALLLHLKNEKNAAAWKMLNEEADNIPNLADSIYTRAYILELSSSLNLTDRKESLENLIHSTSLVNVSIEKIDLIEHIYSTCKGICRKTVRDALNDALLLTIEDNSSEFAEKRKDLIDACYELDEKLSSTLSSLTDSDPYRRKLIESNIEDKKCKEKILDDFNEYGSKNLNEVEQGEYAKFCKNQLAKMNANKSEKRKVSQLFKFIQNLEYVSSENAHTILSFFLQAYGDSFKTVEQSNDCLQPIFKSLKSNANEFCDIYKISEIYQVVNANETDSIVLDTGDDEIRRSISFIRGWASNKDIASVIISEPYFCVDDLVFISDAFDRDYSVDFKIISSVDSYNNLVKQMSMCGNFDDLDEYLECYWKDNICPDSNPRIEFIFCGTKIDPKPMIHDRWWLDELGANGIKLGTSINGIGNKISGINILSSSESLNVSQKLNSIVRKTLKESKGERVIYKSAMIF
ncbi:hypothetical protein CKQ84_12925 [Shewanella sp. WE21]|uniref:NACHT domain-containing protein n=1 Tax=Shewanella sp. WE21 TaxID=2029986 RepID=UPI000CF60B84|nr:ATP-binding protein [Shewanella sp. WE21]AVI66714.1 hypothetical protein CKQ84_12925 [Shewanella sp. WE21]